APRAASAGRCGAALWRRRPLSAVVVGQADDVVQLGRGDLDDQRVLERAHAVDGARREVERVPRPDFLLLELVADLPQLEGGAALADVPGLVLDLVVRERRGLSGADEEEFPGVPVALGPDELPAPGLLDLARLGPHAGTSHSGWAATCSCAARRSFGV